MFDGAPRTFCQPRSHTPTAGRFSPLLRPRGIQKFALIDDVAGHVYNRDLPIAAFLEALENFEGVLHR